ncbi:serine/threonine-protein kinase [Streptomyces silaceus]|uniref:serine/threonine-protein kinase n=1 Tax=Streptomyces silaceus TaxID=545123 RepID=UPI0006EB81D2|nr:serine/threonine-protein kinase [Streptomyces silaceus]
MLHVPLHREFQFIHEPLPVGDESIPVLGHEDLVALLCERLMHSHGGTFLVTGFRGVGKTTLVTRALAQAAARFEGASGGGGRGAERKVLLTVHLSVARRMGVDQLLFAVVRRVFEALDDRGLVQQLPPDVRESLLLAYTRTSLSFTQTQSEGTERGGTLGVGPQQGSLSMVSPTLNVTSRRTRNRTTEAAFLAYSETDVEHDLVRIIQLLSGGDQRPGGRRGLRRRKPRLLVHPVIVLDEVDKFTDSAQDALTELEQLLGALKNVFTTRGAHFVLVAGPDLHDRALSDADRGSGLYESVFAWRMYVPCLWTAPHRLVRESVERARTQLGLPPLRFPGVEPDLTQTVGYHLPEMETIRLGSFIAHLRFKARGIPRRLLQEFNSLIMWDDSGLPSLYIGDDDWQRVLFYSQLDTIMSEVSALDGTDPSPAVLIDRDGWNLGCYHTADWVLRSRGRAFSAQDVVAEDGLMRARFRREGDIGIRVRHPNVVRIITSFDLPEPAIVMELAEGPSLDQLLERHGSLPPSDVAWIGRVLGEALEYLHSLQMSRIDLKPANVIVTRDRGPLIVDLGLVRPKDTSESITGAGSVMGTIPYMAPEQIRDAKAADIRSDVYALGAVLYQCITGRRLYNGDNPVEVVFAILREPATLGDLPVSPLLNDVLHTCLARDPADRYQDPSGFLQALARTPEAGQEPTLRLTEP